MKAGPETEGATGCGWIGKVVFLASGGGGQAGDAVSGPAQSPGL